MNLVSPLSCPWCKVTRIEASPFLNKVNFKMWRAKCMNCGAGGPVMNEAHDAIQAWCKREIGETKVVTVEVPVMPLVPAKVLKEDSLPDLARRYMEVHGHCLCADQDIRCVRCKLTDALRALK